MHRISAESEETLKVFCMSRPANKKWFEMLMTNIHKICLQFLAFTFLFSVFNHLTRWPCSQTNNTKYFSKNLPEGKEYISQRRKPLYFSSTNMDQYDISYRLVSSKTNYNYCWLPVDQVQLFSHTYIKPTGLLLASWNSYPCGPQ